MDISPRMTACVCLTTSFPVLSTDLTSQYIPNFPRFGGPTAKSSHAPQPLFKSLLWLSVGGRPISFQTPLKPEKPITKWSKAL